MPNGPSQRDVHVNKPLTNISVAFLQSADAFVATRVFPNVPVRHQSDRYFQYDRGDFNRDEAQKRADCTESAGGGYKLDSSPTYCADVYAFHKDIGTQTRANADSMLNLDREAAEYCTHKMLIRREKDFVARYMTPGTWAEDLQGIAAPGPAVPGTSVIKWSDASSTPITDVRSAMTRQQKRTGFRPNTLVLARNVFDVLIDNEDIVDRVKYGTQSQVSTVDVAELRALWKIDRILIMDAIENRAEEGVAFEDKLDQCFISENTALLAYSAPRPGLMTPSAGYTFSWTGFLGSAGGLGIRTRRFFLQREQCDRIECEMAYDLKLVAADMGTLFYDLV